MIHSKIYLNARAYTWKFLGKTCRCVPVMYISVPVICESGNLFKWIPAFAGMTRSALQGW